MGLFGNQNKAQVKKLKKIAGKVVELEEKYKAYSNEQLRACTDEFKDRLKAGATLNDILPEAFAVVREASTRVLNMRHYYVQILGGIALHQGRIAEMATGEGKTLVETLPAYLNALTGKGVHIVTVNEYLAKRDAEWMGKVYKFLGLTVGVILNEQKDEQKKIAYRADITYTTNNELGFDYLRDNMARNKNARVQRGLNFAIVDEVDSILIDEARTPLIISGKGNKSSEGYVIAQQFVKTLNKEKDVDIDIKTKQIILQDSGIAKAEAFYNIENLSDIKYLELNHNINNALRANFIMKRDENYIVKDGEVIIVDEFTGRLSKGRRFSSGLHQAIEAKEGVEIKDENQTLATITFQNFFRLYTKLSGMTGTAKTEEGEFRSIYSLDVVEIPPNKPRQRIDYADIMYVTENGKIPAIIEDIKECQAKGRPVLVGTINIDKSEMISKHLKKAGIKHQVLNAKNNEKESEIVAQAGRKGTVTIATNMAGRGTDILLGGNPEFMATKEMRDLGFSEEEISYATAFNYVDDETLNKARDKYTELYKKHKEVTDAEKEEVKELGGLHIIGTERHESRRIDNQLRGRAGRQGDPGTSIFFISTEDEMIRVFGGEMMGRVMAFVNFDEDTAIQSKMLTRMIASCQKRLEGMHFSSRKNVLQFDDVNNQQRKAIYKERDRLLNGEDVHADILQMAEEYARFALENACEGNEDSSEWDIDKVNANLFKYFVTEKPLLDAQNVGTAREVLAYLTQYCRDTLDTRYKEEPLFVELERVVLLQNIDKLWMDHIDALDEVRKGVGLQSIGQHDPLMVYKKEAFEMFEDLNKQIKMRTIGTLLFARIKISGPSQPTEQQSDINPNKSKNKPCPCGSGKKYKDCCYQRDLAAQQAQEQSQQDQPSEEQQPTVLTNKERWALAREERRKNKKK